MRFTNCPGRRRADDRSASSSGDGPCRDSSRRSSGHIARYMVENVGTDLYPLHNEMEKLRSYVGDSRPIEARDIDVLILRSEQFGPFELDDAILARNYPKAVRVLGAMMNKGLSTSCTSKPLSLDNSTEKGDSEQLRFNCSLSPFSTDTDTLQRSTMCVSTSGIAVQKWSSSSALEQGGP